MSKYSSGKFALRISDRSGMAFPYNEMVQEWNGSWVHTSEFEPKQPQLDPRNHPRDFTALQHAKPQIANSRVYVGNNTVRTPTGNVVLSPNGDVYDEEFSRAAAADVEKASYSMVPRQTLYFE